MVGKEIQCVLKAIEDNGYRYCIFGGEGLPETFFGSDIDIVINRLDQRVFDIFEEYGFVASKRVQCFTGHPMVFCKYVENIGWLPLHIIEKSFFGFQIVPDNFEKYTFVKGSFVFATDPLYLVLITSHCIIKSQITEKRLNKIKTKIANKTFNINECHEIIANIDFRLKESCKKLLSNKYKDISIIKKGTKHYTNSYQRIVKSIKGRLFKKRFHFQKRGLLVALEGIDGSGKTTFINTLNKSIPKKNRNLFLVSSMAGRGFYRWVRITRGIWRRSCDKKGILPSILKNSLVPMTLILEITNSYLIYMKAYKNSLKGYNIIFDRYSYIHHSRQIVHNTSDFFLKMTYISMLKYFLIDTFPVPDLVVYLELAPEIAYQRKQEDTLEELTRKKEIYDSVLTKIEKRTYVERISATENTEKMASTFLNKNWQRLV